ncbi:MAG TPA: ergothioneine biosynthesis protein EgtB [Acidimicrobiales bacterium]|nr:ergothioneine biosynthesis protein EgtB [Acidimicrobiales bacterium]
MNVTEQLAVALESARARSLSLLDRLDDEALLAQHSPLMSPLVWDLAHVGNYEDLWLVRQLGGTAVLPEIDELYDAFLQPRARRPELPLLSPAEALRYVERVRGRALELLESADLDVEDPLLSDGYVHRMVIQHEHQHDETMLATLQLSGLVVEHASPAAPSLDWSAAGEVQVEGGGFTMGTDLDPWALDNERPAHTVPVPEYFIDVAPVDNAAWIAFIEDGGYETRTLWSPAGWEWLCEEPQHAPLFWQRAAPGTWQRRHLGRVAEVAPHEPVQHVCWHEASAFAAWAGRRLPTESEWEKARSAHALEGVGYGWEWTSSDFLPYPGFRAFPYREYSEAFFGSEYKVLRGSSWATDATVARPTFRNWDLPIRRQIFSGLRTARSA